MLRALGAATLSCQLLRLCVAGGCSGPAEVCTAPADDAGAALGLLQFSSGKASPQRSSGDSAVEAGAGGGNEVASSRRLLQSAAASALDMDCKAYPTLCEEPYNCQSNPLTPEETDYWHDVHVARDDGHPDLRSWCLDPSFEANNVKLCLKNHDLKANAQALYKVQTAKGVGRIDASYCFLEGHCTNTNVTYDTTPEEAEALCDAKYGHESWTTLKFADGPEEYEALYFTGFPSRVYSSYYGKLACAMGNFHCDVIYCQDTYCEKDEYKQQFGHFLKKYGYTS